MIHSSVGLESSAIRWSYETDQKQQLGQCQAAHLYLLGMSVHSNSRRVWGRKREGGRKEMCVCVCDCVCGRAVWRHKVCQTDTNTLHHSKSHK